MLSASALALSHAAFQNHYQLLQLSLNRCVCDNRLLDIRESPQGLVVVGDRLRQGMSWPQSTVGSLTLHRGISPGISQVHLVMLGGTLVKHRFHALLL